MELLMIRHGQSEGDITGRHEGRADYELTDLGILQATKMAAWVEANARPEVLLSSPLKRAAKTAQILAERLNLPVLFDDDFMEFNNGLLAGLTFEEGSVLYPKPEVKHPHESFYGQETDIAFRARAETVLSRILHSYSGVGRVAVVTHGRMMNMLFQSFLGLPMNSAVSIRSGDTGLHLWRIEGDHRHIVFTNRTEHLADIV